VLRYECSGYWVIIPHSANIEIAEEAEEINVCECETSGASFHYNLLNRLSFNCIIHLFSFIIQFLVPSRIFDINMCITPLLLRRLADVIKETSGAFGDAHVYEPYVSMLNSPHLLTSYL